MRIEPGTPTTPGGQKYDQRQVAGTWQTPLTNTDFLYPCMPTRSRTFHSHRIIETSNGGGWEEGVVVVVLNPDDRQIIFPSDRRKL